MPVPTGLPGNLGHSTSQVRPVVGNFKPLLPESADYEILELRLAALAPAIADHDIGSRLSRVLVRARRDRRHAVGVDVKAGQPHTRDQLLFHFPDSGMVG